MELIKIEKLTNGIIVDCSLVHVSGDLKNRIKFFKPKNFGSIREVRLYENRVVGISDLDEEFKLVSTPNSDPTFFPVTHVSGVNVTTLEELFNEFISAL